MDCLFFLMIIWTFVLVEIIFLRQILIMDSLQRIEQNLGDVNEDIKNNTTVTTHHLRGTDDQGRSGVLRRETRQFRIDEST